MTVYRITLEKWSDNLKASGRPARWNSHGKFIIYTAGTRALACLENMVHRRGIGTDDRFRVSLIEIPGDIKIKKTDIKKLPDNWCDYANYISCQAIGDEWLIKNESAVLQVPSAIITEESNFLINPQHRDFGRIKLLSSEKFSFDRRLLD